MSKNKLTADLDRLIKQAAEVKAAGLKRAESISAKLDKAEDGTAAASTGAHAAGNKEEAAEITAGAVDGGAKSNPVNGSVDRNTDGSAASAKDGSKGPAAGEFPITSEADNGPTKGEGKFASVRKLANELRAAADALLTDMDRFLVKAARSSADAQVKTAAEAADDEELADQASDALMEQIATGQISDEDAAQILQEAVQAGAITPEELQEAAALTDQVSAESAAAAAAADPAAAAAAADPAAAAAADPAAAAALQAASPEDQLKIAAAQIGPDHPQYLEKLASIYDEDMQAGYEFFNKLAEVIVTQAEEEKEEEKEGEKEEEKEEKGEEKEKAENALVNAMSGVDLAPADAAEQQALEAVKQELGINDAQLKELAATPVPATQDKVAAAKARYRAAIMAKVAALKK